MTTPDFPRRPPSAAGVDAAGLLAFVDALEATPGVEPHSLMLVRGGSVVAEGWWAPYAADRVHLLYSLSKSFTSTALGLAVAEGLVDLDAPVIGYFPELDAEITDPRSRALTVRHLAAMAAGHATEMLEAAAALDPVGPGPRLPAAAARRDARAASSPTASRAPSPSGRSSSGSAAGR